MSLALTDEFLQRLCQIAQSAGQAVLLHYHETGVAGVTEKTDGSPLTLADLAADQVIDAGLRLHFPDTVRISEESQSRQDPASLHATEFFLIDPLDGTKEFIKKNGEFTVNIALIRQRMPVAGVVHAPATGETWYGAQGLGAWKSTSTGRTALQAGGAGVDGGWVVMGSRSHADETAMNAFLQGKPVARFEAAGSSLKFCRLAQGDADLYPRFGPTMEWDTAAAHAVLAAAGGWVTELDGKPLSYGKSGFRNPHFIAGAAHLTVEQTLPTGRNQGRS